MRADILSAKVAVSIHPTAAKGNVTATVNAAVAVEAYVYAV